MRSTIALAASVALVLSTSLAFAGGKKTPADPRTNNTVSVAHKGGGFTTSCDVDPNCNGWAAWLAQQKKG